MEQGFINTILPKLGFKQLLAMKDPPQWLSYDREGDALHVIFEEAQKDDASAMDKDDIIVTKRGDKIINMTILNVSRFVH
ncbi:MAG: DUF2283 domain-containing protein [Candidatus Levybacteria bacterium]|nr:DUF2283 domain-containing protein [Candidatus Levybacteria bacterium]